MGSTTQILFKVLYLLEIVTYATTVDGGRYSSNKSDFVVCRVYQILAIIEICTLQSFFLILYVYF